MKKLTPCYSGKKSKDFWKTINKLDEKHRPFNTYFYLALELQNIEMKILDQINKELVSKSFKKLPVFKRAVDLFGGCEEEAERWFTRPRPTLGDKTPFELCKTKKGIKMVNDALGGIEHGVFA